MFNHRSIVIQPSVDWGFIVFQPYFSVYYCTRFWVTLSVLEASTRENILINMYSSLYVINRVSEFGTG